MNMEELYALGNKAYEAENYAMAAEYFEQCGDDANAKTMLALSCYSLAGQVSLKASSSSDTATLVKGQQNAVELAELAARHALDCIKKFPESKDNCNVCGMVIAQGYGMQYTLTASGLTTAYSITHTTTTVEKTMLGDTTLWEEITGTETEKWVSLYSGNIHDYSVLGPDEKTKRVEANRTAIVRNAAVYATLLEYLDRPYDGHMLRAEMACQMADCQDGTRRMLLEAEWFITRAKELARSAMSEEEYSAWLEMQEGTTDSYNELAAKYAAMLRSFRRKGVALQLGKFYQPGEDAPAVTDCADYVALRQRRSAQDKNSGLADAWEVFLSTFAQASFMRMLPIIMFASVNSLLFGGILKPNIFSIVWFVVTMFITLVRSARDSSGVDGSSMRLYMLIMIGVAVVFSANFLVGVIALAVLFFLAKRYK